MAWIAYFINSVNWMLNYTLVKNKGSIAYSLIKIMPRALEVQSLTIKTVFFEQYWISKKTLELLSIWLKGTSEYQ